ncbi:MAG: hypothetical protein JOY92_12885 [Verrucomicrobia bacterium]|nr:hypothetical protein [Verrucomicrobiota bacterium]
MKSVFRLHLREIYRENDWLLPLLLLVLAVIGAPLLTPSNEDPDLKFSSRTQLVWATAWFCSIFYSGFVSAKLGACQRNRGLRDFWRSSGLSDLGHYLAIFAIPLLLNALFFGAAAVLAFVFGRNPEITVPEWAMVNLQALTVAVLGQAPVSALVIGMANRLDVAPSFTCGLLFNLYGLYGIGAIDQIRGGDDPRLSVIADIFWTVGPHLHFADFMNRMTFGWGPLPGRPFFCVSLYLGAVSVIVTALSVRLWRYRTAH